MNLTIVLNKPKKIQLELLKFTLTYKDIAAMSIDTDLGFRKKVIKDTLTLHLE